MDSDVMEMLVGSISPIAFFIFLAALILLPRYLRYRQGVQLQEVLRLALEKGQALPPGLMDAVAADRSIPSPINDVRTGIVLLCLAGAMIFLGLMELLSRGDNHHLLLLSGLAAFPGFIGIARLIFGLIGIHRSTLS